MPANARKLIALAATTIAAATVAVLSVVFAQPAAAAVGDTHVFTVQDHDLYDAALSAGGIFRPTVRVTATTGRFDTRGSSVSAVMVGGQLNLLAINHGGLQHSVQLANGNWTRFVDVPGGQNACFFEVVAVNVGGQLQAVCHSGSSVYHAVRSTDGTWTPFIDVETRAGTLGGDPFFTSVEDISAAGFPDGRLEVVVEADEQLYLTTRRPDGTWARWDNIINNTGNPGYTFKSSNLSAAAVGNDLHLVTYGVGGPWHAVHSASGWTRFGYVYDQTGNAGLVAYIAVSGYARKSQLVLAIETLPTATLPSRLLYTVRRTNGTWAPFESFPGDAVATLGIAVATE